MIHEIYGKYISMMISYGMCDYQTGNAKQTMAKINDKFGNCEVLYKKWTEKSETN